MDLKMVEATEEMADQLVSFHNSHFKDNRRPEHWIWEYKGCYPDLAIFTVMTERDRIAGTQGLLPIYLRAAGERILSGKPENSLVARDLRGGDIYNSIYVSVKSVARERGYQCLWGYGPLYKASLAAGYTVHKDAMCSLGAVISPASAVSDALKSKKHGLKTKIAGVAGRLLLWIYGAGLRASTTSSNSDYVLKSELSSQTDLDDLYRRLRRRFPDMIHIDLDERYLKWRIHTNPFCTYKTYFVYRGAQLEAYSFVNSQETTRAFLTDFTFDDVGAAKFLLSTMIDDLKAQSTGVLIFIGNAENVLIQNTFKLLRRWGFAHFSSTNFHTQNIQLESGEMISRPENWYMTGTGSEGSDV
ncbi:MAG TPA: hypothetical protein VK463_03195 [Desulfomonilaceae bacterium]|nr:hypothetical protein [Desulfomonilaceae bacterium]